MLGCDKKGFAVAAIIFSALTLSGCESPSQSTGSAMPSVRSNSSSTGVTASSRKGIKPLSGGYTITDLGALPGDASSEAGLGTQSYSDGLNNLGQVSGASSNPSADVATLFSNGSTTNLNTLNASVSLGNAINASGQVAGEEENPSNGIFHAFLYTNGSMQDINDNTLFPNGSIAYGINKSGQVVGQGFITNSNFHAFLYANGKMTDLNPFNGFQSIARSINDSGQVIGSSTGNNAATWLYANGTLTVLSTSNSGYFINNNGQIVGVNSSNRGALYSNGSWTDLGTLQGATSTIAMGINSSSQIVGTALFPVKSYHPFVPGPKIAVIFTNNGPADLNKVVGSSGYSLNYATAINDSGQIAVVATNSSKQRRALLLTPK